MKRSKGTGDWNMVRWNFNIPPAAVDCFVKDLRAYHATDDQRVRRQILERQLMLVNRLGSRRIGAPDLAEVFRLMKPNDESKRR